MTNVVTFDVCTDDENLIKQLTLLFSYNKRAQKVNAAAVIASKVCLNLTTKEAIDLLFTRELGGKLLGPHFDTLCLADVVAVCVQELHLVVFN